MKHIVYFFIVSVLAFLIAYICGVLHEANLDIRTWNDNVRQVLSICYGCVVVLAMLGYSLDKMQIPELHEH